MEMYHVKIRTISPLCLGSGQADVNVDADIVHDIYGIPYFPGRRLRGLLYESAVEVTEMADLCGVSFVTRQTVDELFHHVDSANVRLVVPDFYITNYKNVVHDWQLLQSQYADVIQPDMVLDYYTSLRFQTAIDEETGIAKEHSLRNIRVMNSGIVFEGTVQVIDGNEEHQQALALAFQNLRRAGMNRNRGFGQIKCEMEEQKQLVNKALGKGGNP